MADNTNKVTIDAAWFAELYAAKKDKEQYAEAVLNIAKERDGLKAKLDCADVDRETYKDRAEAAERCIEEVWNFADSHIWIKGRDTGSVVKTSTQAHNEEIGSIIKIINAYRERKEEK